MMYVSIPYNVVNNSPIFRASVATANTPIPGTPSFIAPAEDILIVRHIFWA